jgi:hypothetical protein
VATSHYVDQTAHASLQSGGVSSDHLTVNIRACRRKTDGNQLTEDNQKLFCVAFVLIFMDTENLATLKDPAEDPAQELLESLVGALLVEGKIITYLFVFLSVCQSIGNFCCYSHFSLTYFSIKNDWQISII